ncbi:unnamed protein product [Protopolystoma xenopodis]|uniref:Uncharacterized protein n=1 Tax=Protopolystoma xenopodis TaxID=117903 RepID=A0A3S5BDX1_9PLAT|nr:unnamed protein product [Protopolystoma xenopodis]
MLGGKLVSTVLREVLDASLRVHFEQLQEVRARLRNDSPGRIEAAFSNLEEGLLRLSQGLSKSNAGMF